MSQKSNRPELLQRIEALIDNLTAINDKSGQYLHEVGAYGNRHSLMPDLNGDEWTGCPKWLDEQC